MGLVSASRDGQILVDLLKGGRLEVVRGSSSAGFLGGARGLLRSLRDGKSVVSAWDGPRGPRGVPKPGPAWLARLTGAPLLEIRFECSRRLRLGDWSRMELPFPFSEVRVLVRPVDPQTLEARPE